MPNRDAHGLETVDYLRTNRLALAVVDGDNARMAAILDEVDGEGNGALLRLLAAMTRQFVEVVRLTAGTDELARSMIQRTILDIDTEGAEQ